MIKAIIFDLDGTLTDTLDDLADAVNHVLDSHSFPLRTREEIRSFVGNGLYMLMRRSLPSDITDDLAEEYTRELTVYYNQHSLDKTKPYEGIVELLKQCREDGIICAVATNKREAAAIDICCHFFGDLLFSVKGDNGIRPLKPDRAIIDELLSEMKLMSDEVIYVGDSEADAYTAQNAGLQAIGVLWGFRTKSQLSAVDVSLFAEKSDDIYNIVKNCS